MNNNNDHAKNVAAPAPSLFGYSGTAPQPQHPFSMSQQLIQLLSRSQPHQPQTQFPGRFQFSEPQPQVLAQAQYAQASHAPPQSQTQCVSFMQNANSNVANIASTPAIGSARRATQKTLSQPPGSSNASQYVPLKTMESAPTTARRRKRE